MQYNKNTINVVIPTSKLKEEMILCISTQEPGSMLIQMVIALFAGVGAFFANI